LKERGEGHDVRLILAVQFVENLPVLFLLLCQLFGRRKGKGGSGNGGKGGRGELRVGRLGTRRHNLIGIGRSPGGEG
jgi:hypothetical protein